MRPWSAVSSATAGEHRRLLQGLEECATAQRQQLADLLSANASSEFGRSHGFDRIRDPDAYRGIVPLSTYDDFAADIQYRPKNGLLGEPILLYEETSGSSGSAN